MYTAEGTVQLGSRSDLIEALRPVADAVRKKKYRLWDGTEKPPHFRVELNLSVAECKKIMSLVDAADVAILLRAAG
jgi:hypothetical protein